MVSPPVGRGTPPVMDAQSPEAQTTALSARTVLVLMLTTAIVAFAGAVFISPFFLFLLLGVAVLALSHRNGNLRR